MLTALQRVGFVVLRSKGSHHFLNASKRPRPTRS